MSEKPIARSNFFRFMKGKFGNALNFPQGDDKGDPET